LISRYWYNNWIKKSQYKFHIQRITFTLLDGYHSNILSVKHIHILTLQYIAKWYYLFIFVTILSELLNNQ